MFVTWVIYLLAVQCFAEGNTVRLDKKVPIGATNTSEVSDVGTEASKENENISIDIPDSESKTNKSNLLGTKQNSKINSNRKPEDLGLNEDFLMTQNTVNVLLSLCCIALSFTMIYFRIRTKSKKLLFMVFIFKMDWLTSLLELEFYHRALFFIS